MNARAGRGGVCRGMCRVAVGAAAGGLVTAHAPLLGAITPLRRAWVPDLAGLGPHARIALTFDDGPDPGSTPAFLDLLASHDVRATFFLLGEHAARHPTLVAAMVGAGHELAVHGWDHTCVLRKRPSVLAAEVSRTATLLEDLGGTRVQWYRPPYGVLTTPALLAARRAGLHTVLWSSWGRDWERGATPERIVATVRSRLRVGGTLLLHDTDRAASPDSWRRTLVASRILLEDWAAHGLEVGPLKGHGLARSVGLSA